MEVFYQNDLFKNIESLAMTIDWDYFKEQLINYSFHSEINYLID